MQGNHAMRILISITMIFGACLVVLIGLLSVVHDLLIRTTSHVPSEFDRHELGSEGAAMHAEVSEGRR
jgi:hypothetical protein